MKNAGKNKDTIPITSISNLPIPISDNVKANALIIFTFITSFEVYNSLKIEFELSFKVKVHLILIAKYI